MTCGAVLTHGVRQTTFFFRGRNLVTFITHRYGVGFDFMFLRWRFISKELYRTGCNQSPLAARARTQYSDNREARLGQSSGIVSTFISFSCYSVPKTMTPKKLLQIKMVLLCLSFWTCHAEGLQLLQQ